ncbi:unnamed protein product [Caretta caretta]
MDPCRWPRLPRRSGRGCIYVAFAGLCLAVYLLGLETGLLMASKEHHSLDNPLYDSGGLVAWDQPRTQPTCRSAGPTGVREAACSLGAFHPLLFEKSLVLHRNPGSDADASLHGRVTLPGLGTLNCTGAPRGGARGGTQESRRPPYTPKIKAVRLTGGELILGKPSRKQPPTWISDVTRDPHETRRFPRQSRLKTGSARRDRGSRSHVWGSIWCSVGPMFP